MSKKIVYELDPPHLLGDGLLRKEDIEKKLEHLRKRVDQLEKNVDEILITDSVLGFPRVPAIYVADHLVSSLVKDEKRKPEVMCSLRTCDHSANAIVRKVFEAMISGIKGMLFVRGDDPRFGGSLNPEIPSKVVKKLREIGFRSNHIKFYLTTGATLNKQNIDREIASDPDGLVTQIIRNPEDMKEISKHVGGRVSELIGTVPVPSAANAPSAQMFGFDVSRYAREPARFVSDVLRYSTRILVTSPRSFDDGLEVVNRLR
ncbi:MAG: hypothetical protein HYU02_01520 [Thaumarchaeota archaeon]|nr:hypothetical protein [Nitrososphaerota archaeon]